jgi:hypothetical protein
MVIVVLALGISLIMWLSTQATADSYRLQDARSHVTELARQVEQLERDVAFAQSPRQLAQSATRLGLIPVDNLVRLRKLPDGTIEQFGEPKQATAPVTSTPSIPPAAPAERQGSQHNDQQSQPENLEQSHQAATQDG